MPSALLCRLLASCVLASLTAACCGDGDDGGGGSDAGAPDAAPPLEPFGRYAVSTRAALPAAAVAPGPAGDAFVWLRMLRNDPAAALATAAGGAGVPAVEDVYGALPATLKDRLDGWINDSLLTTPVGGVPLTQRLDQIIALGEVVLTDFGLDTTLLLAGDGSARHALEAVRFFPPAPLDVVVIPRLDPPGALTPPPATLTGALQSTGARSRALTLGPHGFTLPYGQYAWLAFNKSLHAASGGELAALLASAIDCRAMAAAVAKRCVGPLCVGHEAELTRLCEQGRARIVADVEMRFKEAGFDAIAFESGAGVIGDESGKTTLSGGVWTMSVNAGSGLRAVPATFSGEKQAAP